MEKERTVQASTFKQQCLALLDLVAESGQSIVITKRGRPVARVVPLEEKEIRPLERSVTFLTDDEQELFSTHETWDAESTSDT